MEFAEYIIKIGKLETIIYKLMKNIELNEKEKEMTNKIISGK